MDTLFSIELHSKCLAILDLLKQCGERRQTAFKYLRQWNASKPNDFFRITNDFKHISDSYEKYSRMEERLLSYYMNTSLKLSKHTVKILNQINKQYGTTTISVATATAPHY